jgi:hypothetical protein
VPKTPALSEWGIDKNLACYTAPMVFVVQEREGPGNRAVDKEFRPPDIPRGKYIGEAV